MLASTVAKIQERSPLKYSLARKLVCLDSSDDGVYTRRGCEDVSSCATKADSFRVENIKPGWFHSVSVQEVCVWCKEAPSGAVLIVQVQLQKTRLLLMWHTEQGWRIQRVVVHIADSADPLSQSGCCWKRVFCQQRSAGSNMQEMSLKAIRLVHSSVSSMKIKTSDFTVTDKPLNPVVMHQTSTRCTWWRRQKRKRPTWDKRGKPCKMNW